MAAIVVQLGVLVQDPLGVLRQVDVLLAQARLGPLVVVGGFAVGLGLHGVGLAHARSWVGGAQREAGQDGLGVRHALAGA